MQLKPVVFVALLACTDVAVAAPVKFEGKLPAALGVCSGLTGTIAAACFNNNQKTAGYVFAGISGATGAAAGATALKKKPADATNNMELGHNHPPPPGTPPHDGTPPGTPPHHGTPPGSPHPSTGTPPHHGTPPGSPRPSTEQSFHSAAESHHS